MHLVVVGKSILILRSWYSQDLCVLPAICYCVKCSQSYNLLEFSIYVGFSTYQHSNAAVKNPKGDQRRFLLCNWKWRGKWGRRDIRGNGGPVIGGKYEIFRCPFVGFGFQRVDNSLQQLKNSVHCCLCPCSRPDQSGHSQHFGRCLDTVLPIQE